MEIVQKTIGRMLDEIALRYPNNEALVHLDVGTRYNYSLLSWEVDRAAGGLIYMGIRKGDKVGLWAPNIPEWIVAQFALAKAGAVMVPIDPDIERDELHYILAHSECRAVIMARGIETDEFVDAILSVKDDLPNLEHIFVSATKSYPDTVLWPELTAMGDEITPDRLQARQNGISPEDPVALMYTSGTTGRPKGVVLDHLGLINKSICSARRQGLGHRDRLCLFFPLFHMFGNTCVALSGIITGATLIVPSVVFEPSKVLQAIYKEGCTAVYGSPSMIIGLLEHPEFKKKRWNTVLRGTLGGAPCPLDLMKKLVNEVGVREITVGYGITEASSWVTMTHPEDPLELRVSTIGTPLECNRVKIVSPLTGEDLPYGKQGEICVKGLLMREYYKMPAATATAIDKEGWFHTGDLGDMNEQGYVRITGRLKDVIVRDGIEIHPVEIEDVIYGMPEISEVQVFGFPHPVKGQEVAAWVRLKENAELSSADLEAYVKKNIPEEKAPANFKVVTSFPMTRSGKVQKFKLAEMAAKGL